MASKNKFVSIKNQKCIVINEADFKALQQFEEKYPDLYSNAQQPKDDTPIKNMLV